MRRRPPSPPLFPYTTLFRSGGLRVEPVDSASIPAASFRMRPGAPLVSVPAVVVRLRITGARPDASGTRRPEWTRCPRSEEHTSELQSRPHLVCPLLLRQKHT